MKQLCCILSCCMLLSVSGCLPIELSASSNGTLLIPRAEGVFHFNPKTGEMKKVFDSKVGEPGFALFSPDESEALVIYNAGNASGFGGSAFGMNVVNLKTGEGKSMGKSDNVTYTRWAADGKRFAITRVASEKVEPMDEQLPELMMKDVSKGGFEKLLSNSSALFRWTKDGQIVTFQLTSKDDQTNYYSGYLVKVNPATRKVAKLASAILPKSAKLDLSPDGTTVLYTALDSDEPEKVLAMPERGQFGEGPESKLFRMSLAGGKPTSVGSKVVYALYSPSGNQVLVAKEGEDDDLILQVMTADLKAPKTVANDAVGQVGGMENQSDVYATWTSDDSIVYLKLVAAYGHAGQNLHLFQVKVDGSGKTALQSAIESGIK